MPFHSFSVLINLMTASRLVYVAHFYDPERGMGHTVVDCVAHVRTFGADRSSLLVKFMRCYYFISSMDGVSWIFDTLLHNKTIVLSPLMFIS